MPTIRDMVVDLRKRLDEAGCDSPGLESDALLAHALGVSRSKLLSMRSQELNQNQLDTIEQLAARRIAREPLAYVLGETDFFGHTFAIEAGVLVPRVDTEVIVEASLQLLQHQAPENPRILDLGLGSGCILCSILAEVIGAQGFGVDLSPTALKLSERNADMCGVRGRVTLFEGSWFTPLPDNLKASFDLIVSNPPYIAHREADNLQAEIRDYEPAIALFADEDGLSNYRIILEQARSWLKPQGSLIFEVGYDQAATICEMAREAGFAEVTTQRDTANIERAVIATLAHREGSTRAIQTRRSRRS